MPIWFDFAPVNTDGHISYKFIMIADATNLDRWVGHTFDVANAATKEYRETYKKSGTSAYEIIMKRLGSKAKADYSLCTEREAVRNLLTDHLNKENWRLSLDNRP